ncbi:MAG: hypothetical protein BWY06_01059 [Candidatus Latescibacteria bacterium ADurb.Bin168]|nr:MAG: hypothetical protein BWY06_01059 [Candidatus Latescibacteria bacterium ADurb.Bin168]
MAKAEASNCPSDAVSLTDIRDGRRSFFYRTETTPTCTMLAENHERGGAMLTPAFPDIRTTRSLTDRVETLAPEKGFDLTVSFIPWRRNTKPRWETTLPLLRPVGGFRCDWKRLRNHSKPLYRPPSTWIVAPVM